MNPGLKALGDLSSLFVRFPNSSHTSPQSTLPGLEQPTNRAAACLATQAGEKPHHALAQGSMSGDASTTKTDVSATTAARSRGKVDLVCLRVASREWQAHFVGRRQKCDSWQGALVLRGTSHLSRPSPGPRASVHCQGAGRLHWSHQPGRLQRHPFSHLNTDPPPPSTYKESGHDSQKSHGKLCHWGFLPILRLGAEGCIKCCFVCGI